MWERMLFVLSKVDLLEDRPEALRHVFYELGGLFASSFTFLPNPVADQILTLSLPQRSKTQATSQLPSLQEKIKGCRFDFLIDIHPHKRRPEQPRVRTRSASRWPFKRSALLCGKPCRLRGPSTSRATSPRLNTSTHDPYNECKIPPNTDVQIAL